MADVFTPELTFGQFRSGMLAPTSPGIPYRTIQIGATFSPLSLLPTAWYDPSDLSSMWQDSAGTIPAVVDSPVGKMNDKSGNGYHLLQATASKRPILRSAGGLYWLEFDGVDDFLGMAAGVFTRSIPNTRLSGLRTGGTSGRIFGTYQGANPSLYLGTTTTVGLQGGTGAIEAAVVAAADIVVSEIRDVVSSLQIDRGAATTGDAGVGTSDGTSIGGADFAAALYFTGRFYGSWERNGAGLSGAETIQMQDYYATKQGRTL